MEVMKASGIKWLGLIPNDWYCEKVKYNFLNNKLIVGSKSKNYERLALTLKGVVKRSKYDADGLQPSDFDTYQIVNKNNLIFKLIDLQNVSTSRVGLSKYDGLVSPAYIKLIPLKSVFPKYAEYYFLSMWHRNIFNSLGDEGVRSSLNSTDLLNLAFLRPQIEKQIKIANYLDIKCAKIDSLITDINKQIEILEQYKKSVITESVTKGIDKNVELIDSGIQWIGKIPSSWSLRKGKYFIHYLQKPVLPTDGVITCFRDGEVTLRSKRREDGFTLSMKEIGYQGIDVGDLVVHGMDGFAGAIGISDSRGKASPVLHVLDTNQNKKYIMYYLRSMAYGNIFLALSTGIRVRSCDLNWNKLANLIYPIPSISEQNKIVQYIDNVLDKTNNIITNKQKQLKTLEAYKKALIYEYVTGKKEI